jgi:hypothetical protein
MRHSFHGAGDLVSGTGKWVIVKRRDESTAPGYSIEKWPWLLIYPDGHNTCLCISFSSAVGLIEDAQRALRSARTHFNWLKRHYLAGSVRARLVVTK